MQPIIKNTFDKKLKKEYHITLPAQLLNKNVNDYIEKVKGTYNLNGFRKGQVPAQIILEKHGLAILADEVEKLISENIQKIVTDNKLKLALKPKADLKTMELNKDVEINVTLELFPEIDEIDLKKIKTTKYEIQTSPSDIENEIKKFTRYFIKWEKLDDNHKAKIGDAVNINYVGKVDGVEFEGGKAENHQLELGSKSFIDDFEEQLVGKKANDEVKVKVKFPKTYHASNLADKNAEFQVKINHVLTGNHPEITDEFLKQSFGFENKEAFENFVKKQIETTNNDLTFSAFKQELFEFFNKKYDFELPAGLVSSQTDMLWNEVEEELKTNPQKFKNDKEKEKSRKEKQELAEKMLRSGMILGKISEINKIEVQKEDLDQEFQKILASYPGQEKKVIEYYQKNPNMIDDLRSSIIEKKSIKFIIDQENIEKKSVTKEVFDKYYKKLIESL